ncbi:hypothetical protein L1987_06519 [Smallanthus sonchifolius]|uniref:Uncharacterized protein n=1 Tax=Smallanthus sonchifolius TaxID=185202 RepID=A0ACB9JYC6_9ASTR|nr:hypothetical protein L1987_06519 [Smallanthus sonchifolius]
MFRQATLVLGDTSPSDSMDLERNFVPRHNVVAMDGPIQDPVIPNNLREGVVEDASDSESTESENSDPDAARIPVDRRPQPASYASKRVKMVSADVCTPPGPTVVSAQVTLETQRLFDELINTPPISTSGSPFVTIPVSTSNVSPSRSRQNTRSSSSLRVMYLEHVVTNVLKVNDAYQALLVTHISQLLLQQLHIDSLTTSLENALKQLAAQGKSSCKQETLIIPKDDDDDTEGAQGKYEQPIASSMPGASLASESNAQGELSERNKGKDQRVIEMSM